MKTNYLVLIDFTETSENALRSALNLSGLNGGKVVALHVLSSDKKEEKYEATKKMEQLKTTVSGNFETQLSYGKLGELINASIDLLDIDYVIMGTHGVTGLQKVLGSKALKLVNSSKKPFLITQENKELKKIKTIVMPFSYSSESVQIGNIVAHLAQSYGAKIHLVGFQHDDEWLKNDVARNQILIKRILEKSGTEFEIVSLPGKDSYESELITYSKSISADLIAAAHFSGSTLIIRKNFVRDLISNEYNIPVLTLNAECLHILGTFATI